MTILKQLEDTILRVGTTCNPYVEKAPMVVLWPDKENQFLSALPLMRKDMSNLLTLGPYDECILSGPAIWIRCAVAGKLDCYKSPSAGFSIIYLPGVGKEDLRAVSNCREDLKPIASLQYLGKYWSQTNGKDVTLLSFLGKTRDGIGLDISGDKATRDALIQVLPDFLLLSSDSLSDTRIDSSYLGNLLMGNDPAKTLLQCLDKGKTFKDTKTQGAWKTLNLQFKKVYSFDPDKDGFITGAGLLAAHSDSEWKTVWERYCESYQAYPNIEGLLRKADYSEVQDLFNSCCLEGYPKFNEDEENSLFEKLQALEEKDPECIKLEILRLAENSRTRLDTIWAKEGKAPLAESLKYLSKMIRLMNDFKVLKDISSIQKCYEDSGYLIDWNMLLALKSVHASDRGKCILALLSKVYTPFADMLARNLQIAVKTENYPFKRIKVQYPKDSCLLFVDGLRYDFGRELEKRLSSKYAVSGCSEWCPFPSVTACGKPSVSPFADKLTGVDPEDYGPSIIETKQKLNSHFFDSCLLKMNWQKIEDPSKKKASYGWLASRSIDQIGHLKGCRLASQVDSLLDEIEDSVLQLKNAGWRRVSIVTDHGWLLVPGGFPKCELYSGLTSSQWGRCALLKEGVSGSGYQMVPWSWNNQIEVAIPVGVGSFRDGVEFAHGGLSLEECLTYHLDIDFGNSSETATPEIKTTKWRGLTCSVDVTGNLDGCSVDIRRQPANKDSSILVLAKAVPEDGLVKVFVKDSDDENTVAYIVLEKDEIIVSQQQTKVGI